VGGQHVSDERSIDGGLGLKVFGEESLAERSVVGPAVRGAGFGAAGLRSVGTRGDDLFFSSHFGFGRKQLLAVF
jgi:hypothetical protein